MDSNEVAVHEVESNGIGVIVDLLGESIRQPRKAAHVHPHGKVLALHVACTDMLGVGIAAHGFHVAGDNPVVVVPMSTNLKKASSYNITIPAAEIVKDVNSRSTIVDSVALCGQVFAVDKRKFEDRLGKLSHAARVAVQLGLSYLFDIR
jgi:mRNA-degrading endonuclease toxin of MazEF toxin-antitoxin module